MRILNPADGSVIRQVAEDDDAAIARKYSKARAAQPEWAATPLASRLAMIRRFKEEIARRTDDLAKALTREMGKPIRQSRNELDALRERLDFFLLKTRSALAPETVLGGGKLSERITHEPLGVVANISAWNYPYFVGSNVFVPALLAGNTVLY